MSQPDVFHVFLPSSCQRQTVCKILRQVARHTECLLLLLLLLLQLFVLNISTYALLKHELIVYNIIKAINAAVNLKFYYCRVRSKQYASMFT